MIKISPLKYKNPNDFPSFYVSLSLKSFCYHLFTLSLFFTPFLSTQNTTPPTQPPQQQPPPPASMFASMLLPFIIIFAAFYFLIIRPQKKQEQERKKLLANLQKNDYVLTSGGIYGTIVNVKDDDVTLKIDENVKIKLARSAIVTVINKAKNPEETKQE